MKQSGHSLMAKGIMVLLSLLIMVFIFTYSWFLPADHPVSANGISVNTSAEADFEMAIGFSAPASGGYLISKFYDNGRIDFERVEIPASVEFTNKDGTTYTHVNFRSGTVNLLEDFKPIDLTGDGVTLYRPTMTYKNQSIDYSSPVVDHNVTANKQYISFDLIVRSPATDFQIDLKGGSYVVGACEVSSKSIAELAADLAEDPTSLTVSKAFEGAAAAGGVKSYSALKGTVRKSKYGNFSEDSVVGAVRMAFTQYNVTSVDSLSDLVTLLSGLSLNNSSVASSGLDSSKSLLWIPRPDIYLQDGVDGSWVLHTASDSNWNSAAPVDSDPQDYSLESTYQAAAAVHHYYDAARILYPDTEGCYASRFNTKAAVTDLSTGSHTIIDAVASALDYDDNTYGVCRVNLWIEGTDAEARRAVDGGAFFFGFDLSASK